MRQRSETCARCAGAWPATRARRECRRGDPERFGAPGPAHPDDERARQPTATKSVILCGLRKLPEFGEFRIHRSLPGSPNSDEIQLVRSTAQSHKDANFMEPPARSGSANRAFTAHRHP